MAIRRHIVGLVAVLCLARAVYAASLADRLELEALERVSTESTTAFQARYDACLLRVKNRCHEERSRCRRDCELYAEAEDKNARCKPDKCSLLHRACHKLYHTVCEDFHPIKWVPLKDLEKVANKSTKACTQRVRDRCTARFQTCKENCKDDLDDEMGDDLCHPVRCFNVLKQCHRQHRDACKDITTLVVADSTPGMFCASHPETCSTHRNFVTPTITEECDGDCVQGHAWSAPTTCGECENVVKICVDNCRSGMCQPRTCYDKADKCREQCPFVPALSSDSPNVRADMITPTTTQETCGCGTASSSGSQACSDRCSF